MKRFVNDDYMLSLLRKDCHPDFYMSNIVTKEVRYFKTDKLIMPYPIDIANKIIVNNFGNDVDCSVVDDRLHVAFKDGDDKSDKLIRLMNRCGWRCEKTSNILIFHRDKLK